MRNAAIPSYSGKLARLFCTSHWILFPLPRSVRLYRPLSLHHSSLAALPSSGSILACMLRGVTQDSSDYIHGIASLASLARTTWEIRSRIGPFITPICKISRNGKVAQRVFIVPPLVRFSYLYGNKSLKINATQTCSFFVLQLS